MIRVMQKYPAFWVIGVLILTVVYCTGCDIIVNEIRADSDKGSTDGDSTPVIAEMSIVYVEVQLSESDPVEVFVEVHGEFGGCADHHATDQTRDGNTITIEITTITQETNIGCKALAVLYRERIALGTLEPGDYQVVVNGVKQEFRID